MIMLKHKFPEIYGSSSYLNGLERHIWLCANHNSHLPSLENPDIFEGYGLPMTYSLSSGYISIKISKQSI